MNGYEEGGKLWQCALKIMLDRAVPMTRAEIRDAVERCFPFEPHHTEVLPSGRPRWHFTFMQQYHEFTVAGLLEQREDGKFLALPAAAEALTLPPYEMRKMVRDIYQDRKKRGEA